MLDNEIKFLVALTASEESPALEIADEFEQREADKDVVLKCIRELAEQDIIAFYRRDGENGIDVALAEIARIQWSDLRQGNLWVFMPDYGWELWKTETWGLTKGRAHELMFGSQIVRRVTSPEGLFSRLRKLFRRQA